MLGSFYFETGPGSVYVVTAETAVKENLHSVSVEETLQRGSHSAAALTW